MLILPKLLIEKLIPKVQIHGTSDSSSKNISSGLNIGSDTPQGQINKNEILNGTYATSTSASEQESGITDKTSTNSSGTSNTKEEYTRHLKGNQGISATYQAMIKQFRDNIRAIDYEIIQELNNLFIRIILKKKGENNYGIHQKILVGLL